MIVQILQEFGPRLQGKLPGRKDYARLCERLSGAPPGSVVFLDLAGVELASGSWINAALVPLLAWAADERNDTTAASYRPAIAAGVEPRGADCDAVDLAHGRKRREQRAHSRGVRHLLAERPAARAASTRDLPAI